MTFEVFTDHNGRVTGVLTAEQREHIRRERSRIRFQNLQQARELYKLGVCSECGESYDQVTYGCRHCRDRERRRQQRGTQ